MISDSCLTRAARKPESSPALLRTRSTFQCLAAALRAGALRVAVMLLRARAAEGTDCADQARALVERCLEGAPGLLPAVRNAAEYELCAGNWARARTLADSIRADPVARPMLPRGRSPEVAHSPGSRLA